MYEYDCENVRLELTRNTIIGYNGLKSLVTMDPYNSLDIQKDLVVSVGA